MSHRKKLEQAINFYHENDKKQCFDILKQLITNRPDCARTLEYLIRIYFDNGHYQQAFNFAKQGLSYHKNYGFFHYTLGEILLSSGYLRDAYPFLKQAVALDKDVSQYVTALADYYRKTGEQQTACQHYQRALDCDSTNERALMNYGNLLVEQGSDSEALPVYRRGAEISRGQKATFYRNIIYTSLKSGELSDMHAYFRELLIKGELAAAKLYFHYLLSGHEMELLASLSQVFREKFLSDIRIKNYLAIYYWLALEYEQCSELVQAPLPE